MTNGEEQSGAPAAESPPASVAPLTAPAAGTVVPLSTTIDSIFTTIFATRTNPQGTISQYVYAQVPGGMPQINGIYTDGSMVVCRFEARSFAPTYIGP